MTNLCLYDNEEINTEALEMINKAKSLNVDPSLGEEWILNNQDNIEFRKNSKTDQADLNDLPF